MHIMKKCLILLPISSFAEDLVCKVVKSQLLKEGSKIQLQYEGSSHDFFLFNGKKISAFEIENVHKTPTLFDKKVVSVATNDGQVQVFRFDLTINKTGGFNGPLLLNKVKIAEVECN